MSSASDLSSIIRQEILINFSRSGSTVILNVSSSISTIMTTKKRKHNMRKTKKIKKAYYYRGGQP